MRRIKTTTGPVANVYKRFESVGEFSRYLAEGKTKPEFEPYKCATQITPYRTKFTGTESYEQADKLLLYGDRDLAEKLERAGVRQTRMKLQKQGAKRVIRASVVGFAPHVPNFIAGIPTAMLSIKEKRVPQRVVTIYYNCSVRYGISSDDIIKATANLMSAAMQIEANGTRVNMYVSCICEVDGQYLCATVKVKEAGQPFDTLKMTYPLVHTSMHRRHMFRLMEIQDGLRRGFADCYGMNPENTKKLAQVAKDGGERFDRLFSYHDIAGLTPEQIIKEIEKPQEYQKYTF
jgi:hypothetical protein